MSTAAYQKHWRQQNPDKQRAATARYYQKNAKALIFQQRCRNAGIAVPSLVEMRAKGLA